MPVGREQRAWKRAKEDDNFKDWKPSKAEDSGQASSLIPPKRHVAGRFITSVMHQGWSFLVMTVVLFMSGPALFKAWSMVLVKTLAIRSRIG